MVRCKHGQNAVDPSCLSQTQVLACACRREEVRRHSSFLRTFREALPVRVTLPGLVGPSAATTRPSSDDAVGRLAVHCPLLAVETGLTLRS